MPPEGNCLGQIQLHWTSASKAWLLATTEVPSQAAIGSLLDGVESEGTRPGEVVLLKALANRKKSLREMCCGH